MNRRAFLLGSAAALLHARPARGQDEAWRSIEVATRLEVRSPSGVTRAWLPLAYGGGAAYQRVVRQSWKGNAPVLRAIRGEGVPGLLYAEWPADERQPVVELTLSVETRDRQVDWADRSARGESPGALAAYLKGGPDGTLETFLRLTARRVAGGEADDVAKGRALYEWLVGNGLPRGEGDVNAAFVTMARAVNLPARGVYGLRVARAGDVTDAQHARAEFHAPRRGWIPVDPADARRAGADQFARRRMFGAWKMDWVAYNAAEGVRLPHAAGPPLQRFMSPVAESGGRRLDGGSLQYTITARQA